MRRPELLAFLAISACLTLGTSACGSSNRKAGDGGLAGETTQAGDAEAQNADADALGGMLPQLLLWYPLGMHRWKMGLRNSLSVLSVSRPVSPQDELGRPSGERYRGQTRYPPPWHA